jgi:hypothetical protein
VGTARDRGRARQVGIGVLGRRPFFCAWIVRLGHGGPMLTPRASATLGDARGPSRGPTMRAKCRKVGPFAPRPVTEDA